MNAQRTAQTRPRDHDRVWQFDILVADGFVLTELSAIIEVLRITNRVCVKAPFSWTCRSRLGGDVESSGGAFVHSDPHASTPRADYMFVIGNSDPDDPALSVRDEIAKYTYRDAKVFLLAEAASRFISEGGDYSEPVTTHWENLAFMRERDPLFEADDLIAAETQGIVTCAGMSATTDIVLSVVGHHVSSVETATVADIMLLDRVRAFDTRQVSQGRISQRSSDPLVNAAIDFMWGNLEDPVPIQELARKLGISLRSLERRFKGHLGYSPGGYFRELRLSHANNLLLNTSLSIREIGLACGFTNGFTKQFRDIHGGTPTELRRRGRDTNSTGTAVANHM